jgi:hypothetical protein
MIIRGTRLILKRDSFMDSASFPKDRLVEPRGDIIRGMIPSAARADATEPVTDIYAQFLVEEIALVFRRGQSGTSDHVRFAKSSLITTSAMGASFGRTEVTSTCKTCVRWTSKSANPSALLRTNA